jgi:hypothetical protein
MSITDLSKYRSGKIILDKFIDAVSSAKPHGQRTRIQKERAEMTTGVRRRYAPLQLGTSGAIRAAEPNDDVGLDKKGVAHRSDRVSSEGQCDPNKTKLISLVLH